MRQGLTRPVCTVLRKAQEHLTYACGRQFRWTWVCRLAGRWEVFFSEARPPLIPLGSLELTLLQPVSRVGGRESPKDCHSQSEGFSKPRLMNWRFFFFGRGIVFYAKCVLMEALHPDTNKHFRGWLLAGGRAN